MHIDSFMFDLSLNDKGELTLLVDIPNDMRGQKFDNVEIRISPKDMRRMNHVFQRNTPKECEDCGKPWKLGDPTAEIEETRIKCLCKSCYKNA